MRFFLQNLSMPIPDLILGASLYFPPIFKAFILGTLIWLLIHYPLRQWIYSGKVWHPNLMDLSLFILSTFCAFHLLLIWGWH